ncbi:prostate stem cell antigen-like [Sinocyclocheilus anshuiensis]|uniref:prostate stem cell antigen-like n=1 Tax=Sinocyclocheilus anshuiensis TaxID=1608454 RepID=UPI0007B89C46|nr:PREDICTED: prostate stem cell antigen-like [Sinocyclocheilus anshuiensis]
MMIRIVLGVIAAIGFLTLSEALTCNSCKVGILGKCLLSSQVSCAASELNCFTAKAEFNVTGFLSLSSSGCTSDCNNTAGTVLGAGYTVTKTCCATDLCNGASAAQLSMAGALSAALLASVCSFML